MIDLADYGKPTINAEILQDNLDAYSIFKYYFPEIEYGKLIRSPLRGNDLAPSFGLFYSKISNKLMFKDFGGDAGDVIKFVALLLGISYREATCRIAYDFGLGDFYSIPYKITERYSKIKIENLPKFDTKNIGKTTIINIKRRNFNRYDIAWWGKFGITLDTLIKFNVSAISYFFIDDYIFKADKLAYAYMEEKDETITYKIYQPESKTSKWFTNHDRTVHQGYTQLPEKGRRLIITKSLKDVCCFHDVLNTSAIGIQSETVLIQEKVINEYKSRFEEIFTHFDFDSAGLRCSKLYLDEYDIIPLFTFNSDCKDFSDLVKKFGKNKAINFFSKIHVLSDLFI